MPTTWLLCCRCSRQWWAAASKTFLIGNPGRGGRFVFAKDLLWKPSKSRHDNYALHLLSTRGLMIMPELNFWAGLSDTPPPLDPPWPTLNYWFDTSDVQTPPTTFANFFKLALEKWQHLNLQLTSILSLWPLLCIHLPTVVTFPTLLHLPTALSACTAACTQINAICRN